MRSFRFLSAAAAIAVICSAASCGSISSSSSNQDDNTSQAGTTSAAEDTSASVTEDTSASETAEVTSEAATADDTPAPDIAGYDLLWHDEFSGSELDESLWSRELRQPGWTNEELQEYTNSTDNVFVRDGKLVLKAIKSEKNGKDYYTSGKVNGQHKTDFTYGKVVVSAKVPEGQGLWPAIWMMPEDEMHYGQWPKCGEIDIMEVLGSAVDTAYGTLHYGEPHGEQQGTVVLTDTDFSKDFHEYSV